MSSTDNKSNDNISIPIPRLGTITRVILTTLAVLFALSLIVTPGYPASPSSRPSAPIQIKIQGQSTSTVPANRAILNLQIRSSGSSQTKVANEVRKATEEVLGLLRPHAVLQSTKEESVEDEMWKPVVDLSVNTFSSNAWKKESLFGEKDVYQANVDVSATFEAKDPHAEYNDGSREKDFDLLSVVLAKLTVMPSVTVESLKWTVDDLTKRQTAARVRTDAMQEAVDKIKAYARPLLGDNVAIKALSLNEGYAAQRSRNGLAWEEHLRASSSGMHDELGVRMQHDAVEMFGLEPKTLEATGEIEGEFEVWVPATESTKGSFFHWLRWCSVELSALGAKIVLRR